MSMVIYEVVDDPIDNNEDYMFENDYTLEINITPSCYKDTKHILSFSSKTDLEMCLDEIEDIIKRYEF